MLRQHTDMTPYPPYNSYFCKSCGTRLIHTTPVRLLAPSPAEKMATATGD